MRILQAAEICNPFVGGTRPRLRRDGCCTRPRLRRGVCCSTASSSRHTNLQHVMLRQIHSKTRRQTILVTGQAQSGSAADDGVSSSQPELKQSLSKSGEDDGAAAPMPVAAKLGTLWGLLVLSVAYVHHSTTGFALPALLPLITPDLQLTEQQGALLTAGYALLYAAALIPIGLLADRVNRPRLLAGGLVMWSILTMTGSKVNSFGQLLATRVGFAAAQATQNPVCFSLIPELFPKSKTTAMAFYNSAIYMGRALSFAAVIVAGQLGIKHADLGVTMVGAITNP
ncbi:hypothetical protein ABBQ32_013901 [Trebouxia sp. C0010 RCD-2024]